MTVHAWLRYDVLRRLLPESVESVLEIGVGKGSMGALLARRFKYVGLEPDPASFAAAVHQIGDAGTVLPIRDTEYEADELFDVVCALEVLEHIEDDRGALVDWQRHVKRGGWLLVSVPAGRERFGDTDMRQGHYRRYDRRDLELALADAGLAEVDIVTYGFPIGYALVAGSNVLARRRPHAPTLPERTAASGRWMQPSIRRAALMRAVAFPFQILQRPFGGTGLGTGLVARARVPMA